MKLDFVMRLIGLSTQTHIVCHSFVSGWNLDFVSGDSKQQTPFQKNNNNNSLYRQTYILGICTVYNTEIVCLFGANIAGGGAHVFMCEKEREESKVQKETSMYMLCCCVSNTTHFSHHAEAKYGCHDVRCHSRSLLPP